jgi:hypothetical protein
MFSSALKVSSAGADDLAMRTGTAFKSDLDTNLARREFCPSCQATRETVTQRHRNGHRYSRCLTCARRFLAA